MKSYMCVVCGFVYDEEQGLPEDGIAPGTRWEDIPETWTCPDCGASKDEFELIEIRITSYNVCYTKLLRALPKYIRGGRQGRLNVGLGMRPRHKTCLKGGGRKIDAGGQHAMEKATETFDVTTHYILQVTDRRGGREE